MIKAIRYEALTSDMYILQSDPPGVEKVRVR
jgi:hypothetical protein